MRFSRFFLPTLKETPADAELKSHRFMLKAGMIRKVAAGVYDFLPLGFRPLRKIEEIVREEMNRSGGQEVKLPIAQPANLWRETGRWEDFGPEMFKLKDRKGQEFALGPTHEEVITDLVRDEVSSYKDLPFLLYQVNDKYRDEIRPRHGVMRSREFLMKDGYSFHEDQASLEETYEEMHRCYGRIFDRCGLDWVAVEAPSGLMGGDFSQEFMALAEEGGEELALCEECGYAANADIASFSLANSPQQERSEAQKELLRVETPGRETAMEVAEFLEVAESKIVKTFLFGRDEGEGDEGDHCAVCVRGDHSLEESKLTKELGPGWEMVSETGQVRQLVGADFGSIGPLELDLPVYADRSLEGLRNFVVGANEDGWHFKNVNWGRDLDQVEFRDLRRVQEGDLCPNCSSELELKRGIEVGQIFQLGTKYSESLGADFQDQDGVLKPMVMGCYGIGISRVLGAVIQQRYDGKRMVWPEELTPFQVEIISLSGEGGRTDRLAEELYEVLQGAEVDVLFDDREASPGVKFNDADLIGAPLKLIVGSRGLERGVLEAEGLDGEKKSFPLGEEGEEISDELTDKLLGFIEAGGFRA